MTSRSSDDVKSVRAVAAEPIDQAVFPVEIGLHRALGDIGSLVGPAIAMRRVGLWQDQRRTDF